MSGSGYCSSHTCAESGCYKEVNSANERCATHKKQYNESTGIGTTTCNYSGCKNSKTSGGSYCYTHTCHHGSCKSKIISGSKYCSSHTCAQSGCYKEVNSANSKCSIHKNSTSLSATTTTSGTTSSSSRPHTYTSSGSGTSSSSGRRTDPYNVYSYGSAQDFADLGYR